MFEHYLNTHLAADQQARMRQAADHHRLVKAARRAGRVDQPRPIAPTGRHVGIAAWFGRRFQPAVRVA